MGGSFFGVLQRVGRSFMLPIALLPVAGLLLGIGSSFTNHTMLEAYRLTSVIYEGSLIYTVLDIMNQSGSVVFNNLALLFAMGVAIGMAKQEKDVAALSGAIAYLVMNTAIFAMITACGGVAAMPDNTTGESLGITTLQMGVFGGIIVGLGVAYLHNRFYKIQLPQVLAFFSGTRFVPIIATVVYLAVGIIMFYLWPIVQNGIGHLGNLVIHSGYIGTWIYGIIERALIPFGLHHVFYIPFWQTAVGGTAVIDGVTVQGAQNIFFAELASKNIEHFSVEATRFMAGKFPLMIFGLPGAALAIYRAARADKRKVVGGLLVSAALTAMLTGITEPLEFTFLFVAPTLYAVHCVLAGLSYMLMHLLNVGVGMTFSGGLIDLTLFGILQGMDKTNWQWVVIVGIGYFVLYYIVFYAMITKLDYLTPGREEEGEVKLYTRVDVEGRKGDNSKEDAISPIIVAGLGGKENLSDLDCCATRLRVTVHDAEKVSEEMLKRSGASGVIVKGRGVQIIYGPQVSVIKSHLVDYLEQSVDAFAEEETVSMVIKTENNTENEVIYSPLDGEVIVIEAVPDEAFAEGLLGQGVAIRPTCGILYAPANGVIKSVFEAKHAVTMVTDGGAEILLHIGINTVEMEGRPFAVEVLEGEQVMRGDVLVRFDRDVIEQAGYLTVTPIVICNSEEYAKIEVVATHTVTQGQAILRLMKGED